MISYLSNSKDETIAIARRFAANLIAGDIIFFKGGLGMGKTAFCQGICDALNIPLTATSPTFGIVNEYIGENLTFYHFDMYRIENEDQLYNIGFYDYISYNGVIAIEWSENISSFFSDHTYTIAFEKHGENVRTITIEKETD